MVRLLRDLDAELQIVIGGWRDARKSEAEEEFLAVFNQAGFVLTACFRRAGPPTSELTDGG